MLNKKHLRVTLQPGVGALRVRMGAVCRSCGGCRSCSGCATLPAYPVGKEGLYDTQRDYPGNSAINRRNPDPELCQYQGRSGENSPLTTAAPGTTRPARGGG